MGDYLAQLRATINIDWAAQGNEWVTHLYAALHATGNDGVGFTLQPPTEEEPYYSGRYTGSSLKTHLRTITTDAGLLLFVGGEDPEIVEAEMPTWLDCAAIAAQKLGSTGSFGWSAVIAPHPSAITSNEVHHLTDDIAVTPLRLRPGGVKCAEFITQRGTGGGLLHITYPIVVEGRSDGYSWERAQHAAARTLHSLRSALAVAWNEPFTLLRVPRPDTIGPVEVPSVVGLMLETFDEWVASTGNDPEPFTVSDWLEGAIALFEADPAVADAAGAYLEGLTLLNEHPSMALVAFVAALDGLGAKLNKPERCPECKMITGASSRFRQAVGLVGTEDEVAFANKRLTERSGTAHKGELYGGESYLGSWARGGPFGMEAHVVFETHVTMMQNIARRALLHFLNPPTAP